MISQNLQDIFQNLPEKNAFHEAITLLAVTKKQPIERLQQALDAGIKHIAENTVQEFLQKEEYLQTYSHSIINVEQIDISTHSTISTQNISHVQRHFIGKLQRNKVKYLVNKIDLLHSLDCISLAEEIERQGEKHNWTCRCLLQVNIAKEATKGGFLPEEVERQYLHLQNLPHIHLCGLMTILPKEASPTLIMHYAKQMRTLFEDFKRANNNFIHLSMGMSNDYKLCIEAGSNMIRLGTAIFGNRQ